MTDKTEGNNKVKKVSDDKSQPKPHDPDNNPIYKIIPKTYFSHDQLYPSNEFLQVDEEDTAAGPFKKISTDNPCFEDVPADVYAYDNTVYEQDERLGPLPTANRCENKYMIVKKYFKVWILWSKILFLIQKGGNKIIYETKD